MEDLMKNNLKLPVYLGKAKRKKFKRQRGRCGFSDYDCWNLDHYLMELIPSAIERLVAFGHGYSERLWMFDTMTTRCDLSADDYKAELLKVAAEFRKACKLTDKAIIKEDVDKAKELRLHCFIWLGHNIGTLWD